MRSSPKTSNIAAVVERNARVQRLINERRQKFPRENYSEAFTAVANSNEGSEIFSNMRLANEEAVPTQSPQIVKLLLGSEPWRFPLPDAIYRRLYREKYGSAVGGGYGSPAPAYPSEAETIRKTSEAAGRTTSEPHLTKAEAEQAFRAQVKLFQDQGRGFNESWNLAMMTEPGKSAYREWTRLAELEKATLKNSRAPIEAGTAATARLHAFTNLLNEREKLVPSESYNERFTFVCSSPAGSALIGQMKSAGEPTGERFDPKILEESKQRFNDLVERLALDPKWAGPDNLARRGFAMEKHPQGKVWYADWKRQELLKKREELAKAQQTRAPHLY